MPGIANPGGCQLGCDVGVEGCDFPIERGDHRPNLGGLAPARFDRLELPPDVTDRAWPVLGPSRTAVCSLGRLKIVLLGHVALRSGTPKASDGLACQAKSKKSASRGRDRASFRFRTSTAPSSARQAGSLTPRTIRRWRPSVSDG